MKKRVLIVEDQWETSDLMADMIRLVFKDWQVEQVRTGLEAVQGARETPYDALIIDIALADQMTGIDVVKELCKAPPSPMPSILLMTGLGEKITKGIHMGKSWMEQMTDNEKALIAGFFQKPYTWREFLTCLATSTRSEIPDAINRIKQNEPS